MKFQGKNTLTYNYRKKVFGCLWKELTQKKNLRGFLTYVNVYFNYWDDYTGIHMFKINQTRT